MNLGIYKPSQGYWVRVLTAVFAGSLVLAGAMWAWQQAGTVPIPTPTWDVTVQGDSQGLSTGAEVHLLRTDLEDQNRRVSFGTASVVSLGEVAGSRRTMVLGEVDLDDGEFFGEATHLGDAADGDARVVEVRLEDAQGIRLFEPLYLQAGVAGVLMLLGAVVILFLVGVKRGTVDFLVATDGEMKKVNWSTRREIIGSTWVVVVASFLLAMVLFMVDSGFATLFTAIGVLQ